jgi:hypothetical protein
MLKWMFVFQLPKNQQQQPLSLLTCKHWLPNLAEQSQQHPSQKPRPQALQVRPPEAWHFQPQAQQLVRSWALHSQAWAPSLALSQVLVRLPLQDWSQTPSSARSTACLGQSTHYPQMPCKTFSPVSAWPNPEQQPSALSRPPQPGLAQLAAA